MPTSLYDTWKSAFIKVFFEKGDSDLKKKSILTVAMLFILCMVFPAFASTKVFAAPNFADGEYTVPFTVVKGASDEQSTTMDYMVSPAKVTIQNGKTYVTVTLKNSSWWQYFKVNAGGGYADVQVVSEDKANDKRVVKFEVKDISQSVNAKIHVIVTGIPGFSYDNKYDIRFKFNSSNISLVSAVEKPAPTPTPIPAPSVPVEVKKETPAPKVTDNPGEKKQEAVEKVEPKVEPKIEEKTKEMASKKSDKVAIENVDTKEKDKVETPVAEKPDTTAVKQGEVPNDSATSMEQPKEEVAAMTDTSDEIEEVVDEKEQQVAEEASEVTEKAIQGEVEAESTSKSTSTTLIVIFAVLVLGGLLFLGAKKRRQA